MLRESLLIVSLSFLVGACASAGGRYEAPRTTSPSQFSAQSSVVRSDDVDVEPWWKTIDDPLLAELIEQALVANSDVREAVTRVDAARAVHSATRQRLLPGGGAVASETREQLPGASGLDDRHVTYATGGLEVGWEIDLFGRIRSASRAASARAELTEAVLDDVRIVVAAEVARTYYAMRSSEARLVLREQYRAAQAEQVTIVEARLEEGFATEADLARAKTVLAADDAALASERHNVRRFEYALAVLLGETPGVWSRGGGRQAIALDAPPSMQTIAIGDPVSLLRRRADVRAAERELAAQTAEIGIATAALFPQVEIGGFLGFLAGGAGDLGMSGTSSWAIAPTVRWGILDLGRTRADIRRAKAEAEGALIAYERAVLRAMEDAERSFSALEAAQQTLGATESQLQNARRASELVEAQYEEGVAGYFELLDARRSALTAEIARIDAVAGHRSATVDVFRALALPVDVQ